MKVVINKCFGGFGLSTEAHEWLIKNRGWRVTKYKDGEKEDESAQIMKNFMVNIGIIFQKKIEPIRM